MSKDQVLQRHVLEALRWERNIDIGHIGVSAADGVVTLYGHVPSFMQKRAAAIAAVGVKGVKALADELEVQLPADLRESDETIATIAAQRLRGDVCVPREGVTLEIDKGWAKLRGEVEWHSEKMAAEEDVARVPGVRGVSNEIRIRSKIDTGEISDDITHALHRSWFFDPTTIKVSAEGGAVRLSGYTATPGERQVAAAIAWNAPGVTDVKNEIVIA